MPKKEKTVFISYRRATSAYAARSIFMDLRQHDYDVFMDIESIDSGEFDRIILDQIASRAHFILVLAPGSLDRTVDPSDWLRQEIEHAIKLQRNIIPIIVDDFSFEGQDLSSCGDVAKIHKYNGLSLYNEYFDAGMGKLRERFLKQPAYVAIKPIQAKDKKKITTDEWRDLPPSDYSQILQRLREAGPLCAGVADHIQRKKVKIGFYEKYFWRRPAISSIAVPSGVNLDDAYVLSLIVHEVFHLSQSIYMRLSVQGELPIWQYQKQAYFELRGKEIGDSGEAYEGTRKHWEELSRLSPHSREDLVRAQTLMRKIVPAYRSGCLPLYPLPNEIGYFLKQGKVKDAFDSIMNLITCKYTIA